MAVQGGVGYQLFSVDHSDDLRHADAIVVLGGEHDGREAYGIWLAEEGFADTVLVSDPYWPRTSADSMMDGICSASPPGVTVRCFRPDPSTTRGEARYVRHVAEQAGWSSVIVVTWRFHLVRARYIFGQCFAGATVMHAVPRDYRRPLVMWAYTYAYQYVGLLKALVVGC
ncbi:MAG: YdcF family protein [Gordonia sp. (in: high G+C Gram-positive bacteria)]